MNTQKSSRTLTDDIGCPLSVDMSSLIESRIAICKKCPLYKRKYMIVAYCNEKLYLNPKTNDVSTYPKDGYIKGCGCTIEYKANNLNNHCPCKKW